MISQPAFVTNVVLVFPCYFHVAEPPKCLGPPTPVIVLRTSDTDAEDPPTLEVR